MKSNIWNNLVEVVTEKLPDTTLDEHNEACLVLGLLVERECTHRPLGDSNGISGLVGEMYSDIRLNYTDIRLCIDRLIEYLSSTTRPKPGAVLALTRCYDPRITPLLVDILKTTQAHVDMRDTARHALYGVVTSGVSSKYSELALLAIRDAATHGCDEIRLEAKSYLEHYRNVTEG